VKLQTIRFRDRVEPGLLGEAKFNALINNALDFDVPDDVRHFSADIVEGTVDIVREVPRPPLLGLIGSIGTLIIDDPGREVPEEFAKAVRGNPKSKRKPGRPRKRK
jgi:hypothetical protein